MAERIARKYSGMRVALLSRVDREVTTEKVTFELKEVREQSMWISRRRVFWSEGRTRTKAQGRRMAGSFDEL